VASGGDVTLTSLGAAGAGAEFQVRLPA